ncbi:MAG TPA: hypothetical protein VMS29_02100 [Pyrinomonadaceae bacterium]|nr:hypothetical protein [Pyrinomonadaceae bacterium]
MAINEIPVDDIPAVRNVAAGRNFDHRFFFAVAVLFPLTVLIGFGPTFYLKPLFNTPPIARATIVIHGLLMTMWVLLFETQVYLIASKRIRVHQRLGIFGAVLAPLIFVTGILTAVGAAKYGSVSAPPQIPPLEFMIVPFADMFTFAILFGAAIYYRKNAPAHKRLILLTVINFLPPAIARFPGGLTDSFGPLWFFGVPTVLTLALVIGDTWRNKKLNKPFLFGAVFMIFSMWLRLPLSSTPAWLNFATWITS